MVVIRYTLAALAALWTIGVAVGVVTQVAKHPGIRGLTQLFIGIGAIAICSYFTVILFRNAQRRGS